MAKEVKQWITVNGHHVPIFEGESKADAVKRAAKKTQGTKKTGGKKEPVRKQLKNVPEVVQGATASELHKKLEEQGLGMESADASSLHYRDFNDEEVSLYDAYGNEYRGVFTKGKGGGYEVTGIHKEWYNRKPTDTHSTGVKEIKEKTETQKQISKDNDEKEKQIARNKKEANERTASEKKTSKGHDSKKANASSGKQEALNRAGFNKSIEKASAKQLMKWASMPYENPYYVQSQHKRVSNSIKWELERRGYEYYDGEWHKKKRPQHSKIWSFGGHPG